MKKVTLQQAVKSVLPAGAWVNGLSKCYGDTTYSRQFRKTRYKFDHLKRNSLLGHTDLPELIKGALAINGYRTDKIEVLTSMVLVYTSTPIEVQDAVGPRPARSVDSIVDEHFPTQYWRNGEIYRRVTNKIGRQLRTTRHTFDWLVKGLNEKQMLAKRDAVRADLKAAGHNVMRVIIGGGYLTIIMETNITIEEPLA